ncbi:Asp23/Gls24 family envelope stress response protein [Actinomadura nitritigenes]|uniref:Asp23/Gls24 family envelope stress response protein n=1 Tax=Actinomadura nitritigenes TaxID=134602 RepID=UPI003D89BE0E
MTADRARSEGAEPERRVAADEERAGQAPGEAHASEGHAGEAHAGEAHEPAGEHAPDAARSPDAGRSAGEARPPGERGRTTISDRVVARIVAKAAEETAGSGGLDRSVLGVGLPGRRAARTDVRVHGKVVTAKVALSVEYPMPVRDVARRVREGVRTRVESLTGLTVRQVDIDVAELERPGGRTVS